MLYDRSFAYTVFCDDIRFEQGSKHSFIGVYQRDILIHTGFPTLLPKFCFAVTYFEEKDNFKGDLEIRIFLPGEEDTPAFVASVPLSQLRAQAGSQNSGPLLRAFMPILVSPLTLHAEGQIRVRAYCDGAETKAGTLLVKSAPRPELEMPQ